MIDWTLQVRRDAENVPLLSNTTPLIAVCVKGETVTIKYATTKAQKRELVLTADSEHTRFLAAWPGQWSTDVFEIPIDQLIRAVLGASR